LDEHESDARDRHDAPREAAGPEGEIRPFVAGVLIPKAENDGYTAEVLYGAMNAPTITIRAETPADAFFSGIEWIAARLHAEGFVPLGLWNEPIELPKRPKS
jgi:hypothetical protein